MLIKTIINYTQYWLKEEVATEKTVRKKKKKATHTKPSGFANGLFLITMSKAGRFEFINANYAYLFCHQCNALKRVSFLSHTYLFQIFLKTSSFFLHFQQNSHLTLKMQLISAAASLTSLIIHKEIKIVMKPVRCLVTLPRTDKVITIDQCFNLFILFYFFSVSLCTFCRINCFNLTVRLVFICQEYASHRTKLMKLMKVQEI